MSVNICLNPYRKQRESIKLNSNGIEAIKKQIAREMELNKKLEAFRQRMTDDMNTLSRDCKSILILLISTF